MTTLTFTIGLFGHLVCWSSYSKQAEGRSQLRPDGNIILSASLFGALYFWVEFWAWLLAWVFA